MNEKNSFDKNIADRITDSLAGYDSGSTFLTIVMKDAFFVKWEGTVWGVGQYTNKTNWFLKMSKFVC